MAAQRSPRSGWKLAELADGTRVEWPSAAPSTEGADAVVWSPKAVA